MSNTSSRYTLLLDPGAQRAADRLQGTYALKNRAEVYELAVRVLTWMTDQQLSGFDVGRCKGDDFQPLLLPYTLNRSAWHEGQKAPEPQH
jgi:hypothetical protein